MTLAILALIAPASPLRSRRKVTRISSWPWSRSPPSVGVGLNVLLGLAGQVSLGHVGFYAIGAYAAAS